jgi:hypothetical protein
MNGPGREDILLFIEKRGGRRPDVLEEADILRALGVDGDEALTMMTDFGTEFSVDMAGYEPAFHHLDQGRLLRPSWPLPAPPLYGVRLPLAVSTLVRAAQTGRWPLRYPLLPPAPSRHWLNAPLILLGLPVLAALAIWAFRGF